MKQSTFKMQHPLRFHDNSKPLLENRYDPEKNRAFANNTLQPKSVNDAAIAKKKSKANHLLYNCHL